MAVEIITKDDLEQFRIRLLADLKSVLTTPNESSYQKQWLRSQDVKELLKISSGTLQNLITKGVLHPSKIGGINYFKFEEIKSILEQSK